MNQIEIKLEAIKTVLQIIQEMKRQSTKNQYIANENAWGVFTSKEVAEHSYKYEQELFTYWGKLEELAEQELMLLKRDN